MILLSLAAVLTVLAFLLPSVLLLFCAPSQFSHTFFGELNEKHDRLSSIDSPKLAVIGGSSVAFGLDSARLSAYTGYPVVNFGLYADLGTKMMLDLARDDIRAGDVIVLAPELDAQTLSLYFNGLSALKAADDDRSILRELPRDNLEDVWGAVWQFLGEKWKYLTSSAPDPAGVYNAGNFNEYGDIDPAKFPRPGNVMAGGYDEGKIVTPDISLYDPAFLEYLNAFIDEAKGRGATVYYTFCPVNALAVDTASSEPLRDLSDRLGAALSEVLHCDVLGSFEEAVMDSAYFYDSNFHLNDLGVPIRTSHLAELIDRAEGIPFSPTLAETWSEGGFIFRSKGVNGCEIIGVESPLTRSTGLLIPTSSRGQTVISVSSSAFSNCKHALSVMFPPASAVREVGSGAFEGLPELSEVYLLGVIPETFPTLDQSVTLYIPEGTEDAFTGSGICPDSEPTPFDPAYTEDYIGIIRDMMTSGVETETLRHSEGLFQFLSVDGGETWTVSSLTEEGRGAELLPIPAFVTVDENERSVVGIEGYAFADGEADQAVVIGEDVSYLQIANFAFAGSRVKALLLFVEPAAVSPVNRQMASDADPALKFYVRDEDALSAYKNDYYWQSFANAAGDDWYRVNTRDEKSVLDEGWFGAVDTDADDAFSWRDAFLVILASAAAVSLAVFLPPLLRGKKSSDLPEHVSQTSEE